MRPGETVFTQNFEVQPGGSGFNQSIAISKAGSQIYHAGKIGPDGQSIIQALNEYGVNTEFISTDGSASGHAIVQINRFCNQCVLTHSGANLEIKKEEVDRVLASFSNGDLLIAQDEISNLPYIVHSAYQKNMIVALKPSSIQASLEQVDLHKVRYLILNAERAQALTKQTRPGSILDALLAHYPRLKIVLTLGKNGSFYADEMHRLRQNAFIADPVDSSAVSDTFFGYFISRVIMGYPTWSALRAASIASAMTLSRKGSYTSIPCWEDVLCFSAAG
jgi:ribokinase